MGRKEGGLAVRTGMRGGGNIVEEVDRSYSYARKFYVEPEL